MTKEEALALKPGDSVYSVEKGEGGRWEFPCGTVVRVVAYGNKKSLVKVVAAWPSDREYEEKPAYVFSSAYEAVRYEVQVLSIGFYMNNKRDYTEEIMHLCRDYYQWLTRQRADLADRWEAEFLR